MWEKGYSIFVFAYGGNIYNASGLVIDQDINNFFEQESDAWFTLGRTLNGLSPELSFTVLPVMKFVK